MKTGAAYKIELRKKTQKYIEYLKKTKKELEEITKNIKFKRSYDLTSAKDINDTGQIYLFHKFTLDEINEILSLFEYGTRKRNFLREINSNWHFTDKEKEILIAVYDGLSIDEIAKKFCNSINTINAHLKNILKKLENDIILDNVLKDKNAEFVDYFKNCIGDNEKYKLTKPYETIKRFVNIKFNPHF